MKSRKFIPTYESAFINKTHQWTKVNENAVGHYNANGVTDLPCLGAFNDNSVVSGVIESFEEDAKEFLTDATEMIENPDYMDMYKEIGEYLSNTYIPKYIKDNLIVDVKFDFKNIQANGGNGFGYAIVDMFYNKEEIIGLIEENKELLKNRVNEEYTSRDGFISFVSNDVETWIDTILKQEDKKQVANMVSFILNELMIDSGLTTEILYYAIHEKFSGSFIFIEDKNNED